MVHTVSAPRLAQRTWHIKGQVQGVGFRPFVYRLATELELGGTVRNDPTGVTIEAWGPSRQLDELERRLPAEAPALACVESMSRVLRPATSPVTSTAESPLGDGFRIIDSDRSPARRGRVTVDSAVCPDCLEELFAPSDRRHGHALINCTNCGPRYTIIRDLPYDRPLTTMAPFEMCPRCVEEYENPADRRFHAQPTCCPACGPRLTLIDHEGGTIDGDPIRAAGRLLGNGGILAMKGLGGYHLVADAGCEPAVARLRRGKKRDHKPFAVMAPDVESLRPLVELTPEARGLLRSPICPIVLAPRRDKDAVAASVAPGSHRLGVMVPYTPMQHQLFGAGGRHLQALVMTSANLSDDPLISDDEEARQRLAGISDALLTHDRPIERAVDDSIVIDAPTGILPLRRARGYVPCPLTLPVAATSPGLCVGGELKCTVAVVRDDQAVLSEHLGDLTYALAYRRFEQTIEDLLRLFDVEPRWVACDAHPAYLSHRYAKRAAADRGLDLVVVQHHQAHLASLLAEHGRRDRVVGLICDGVGYGTDGTAWGGEILLGSLDGFERRGRVRPLRLPGGDAAARETGRCGLSWLVETLGVDAGHHPAARRAVPDPRRRAMILDLLDRDLNCPPSSGLGRLFDAAASLLGVCDFNHHEAMSGMKLEALASRAASCRNLGSGLIRLRRVRRGELLELDHVPLLQAMLERLTRGEPAEGLSRLFHEALADGLARAAARTARRESLQTVALSGGVFCNTLLSGLVAERLGRAGLEVLSHRTVPPNDGGIALGQAAVAAASLARK